MTKYLLICFSLCFSKIHFGQTPAIKIQKQKPVPAKFPGGQDSLNLYLSYTVSSKRAFRQHGKAGASIEISSEGEIIKVDLITSTKHNYLDSLFIDAIKKMPKWIPAKNELGNNCTDKQIIEKTFYPQIGIR